MNSISFDKANCSVCYEGFYKKNIEFFMHGDGPNILESKNEQLCPLCARDMQIIRTESDNTYVISRVLSKIVHAIKNTLIFATLKPKSKTVKLNDSFSYKRQPPCLPLDSDFQTHLRSENTAALVVLIKCKKFNQDVLLSAFFFCIDNGNEVMANSLLRMKVITNQRFMELFWQSVFSHQIPLLTALLRSKRISIGDQCCAYEIAIANKNDDVRIALICHGQIHWKTLNVISNRFVKKVYFPE